MLLLETHSEWSERRRCRLCRRLEASAAQTQAGGAEESTRRQDGIQAPTAGQQRGIPFRRGSQPLTTASVRAPEPSQLEKQPAERRQQHDRPLAHDRACVSFNAIEVMTVSRLVEHRERAPRTSPTGLKVHQRSLPTV